MAFKKYSAIKDPDSIVDYGRVWGGSDGWLGAIEEVVSSVWIITSEDEEIPTLKESTQGSGISLDKKDTSIWLEGGTPGISYNLTNRIVTNENREEDRTGIITVEEK